MKVFVIIPAAGMGTRMTSASPASKKPAQSKQFTELAGTPILLHTLLRFIENPQVSEIYVALRKSEIAGFRDLLNRSGQDTAQKPIHLVEGGEHRQDSVANALAALRAAPDDVVLVHDAVRPFVSQETIHDVITAAHRAGAAIAGVPAVDTVKQVERTSENAIITATLPRERLVLAQTPQGFRYSIVKAAFDQAIADGFMGTDEASLVERSGETVTVVMGSPKNIKITTPLDMELAEFFLKSAS